MTSASVRKGPNRTGPSPSRDDSYRYIPLNFGIWLRSR